MSNTEMKEKQEVVLRVLRKVVQKAVQKVQTGLEVL